MISEIGFKMPELQYAKLKTEDTLSQTQRSKINQFCRFTTYRGYDISTSKEDNWLKFWKNKLLVNTFNSPEDRIN